MIDDVLHVLTGQVAEAALSHQDVGVIDQVPAGNVREIVRVDLADLRGLAEKNDGLAAVDGEQATDHRQPFLETVLLVARYEYHASPVAMSAAPSKKSQPESAPAGTSESGVVTSRQPVSGNVLNMRTSYVFHLRVGYSTFTST